MRRFGRLISDGGFTLVELIVTLLVIAVIAVIAAPKMSSEQVSVATEAEQLAGDIRYVQTLAMTQAQRYRINLTATAKHETARQLIAADSGRSRTHQELDSW